MSDLDARVAELAERYRSLAAAILAEAIRVQADHVDAGDPECGLSNHEGPRLEGLRKAIIDHGAVRSGDDVGFDTFGNLVWTVQDPTDGVALADKRVIYFDGHSDTVNALRSSWLPKTGGADAYEGLVAGDRLDHGFLESELGYVPPREERSEYLLFGRGSADQLGGVVAQIVATKIMLELASEGALAGVIVRCYASVAEEDNDGGGPMYLTRKVWPSAGPEFLPDAIVLTEGTGDAKAGALGIYRGQRGRMQIEVIVTGRSCHGSMPWEGLNPLEYGAAIIAEAAAQHDAGEGFADHAFLGKGTRTASWAQLDTPSDCAVPERFTFRFDRRLTVGETPEAAVAAIAGLSAVGRAREAGLDVDVSVPTYDRPTWRGYTPGNAQIYPGWETPEDHPAIRAAVDTYEGVVSPGVAPGGTKGALRQEARVSRWIFSTDGVGFPVPADHVDGGSGIREGARKRWVTAGDVKHPPMLGFGPGIEQNTHKIGECVDVRELQHAVGFLARFPSVFRRISDQR